ncbi:MAG: hypothetical protein A2V66_16755 [Ignavibacteria bacterium RBG_13_36_8]|nr:MAG: hypothetical protein A2V66_16755 [Ignavibacteria bacterium RBG_13_36_8]
MYRIVFKRLMARNENPDLSLKERIIIIDFYLTEEAYKSFLTLYMLLNSKSKIFIMPRTEKTTALFQS